jgi:hypothetical protein
MITVEIGDGIPMSVYYNLDDNICTSVGPEVVIKDGAGNILAAKDAPKEGGIMVPNQGCLVPVVFTNVPHAEIYVVELRSSTEVIATRTVQSDRVAQTIRLDV